MLPIILDPSVKKIGLAGAGEALARRRAFLAEAGAVPVNIVAGGALDGLGLLFVAGLAQSEALALAERARAVGILVNVEDEPGLCDFHVPATVRRGDLLLTVSSAGRAPGLVRLVREWLSEKFSSEWTSRTEEMGRKRAEWRASGLPAAEIAHKTRAAASRWFA